LRERIDGWMGPQRAPFIAMAAAGILLLLSLIIALATC
jgi:hypothetical protein